MGGLNAETSFWCFAVDLRSTCSVFLLRMLFFAGVEFVVVCGACVESVAV